MPKIVGNKLLFKEIVIEWHPVFMNDERIINLEIKFAHQDDFLEQLNQVVTRQQVTIERLEKEILDLKRNINAGGGVDRTRTLADDKPPHY
jgi:SlyX protein